MKRHDTNGTFSIQSKCHCPKFLDPYPGYSGNVETMVHYCRVCNIQLNSCRQAEIHSKGKKHDKRLQYFKVWDKNRDKSVESDSQQQQQPPLQQQQPVSYFYSTFMPPLSNTYYYTANPTQYLKSIESASLPQIPNFFNFPPPSVPSIPSVPPPFLSSQHRSPLLPTPSHIPPLFQRPPPKQTTRRSPESVPCEVCRLTFSSMTAFNNHILGSRHSRKVNSRKVFRQLQDSGVEFSQDDGIGREGLRCEVCQVMVNSSHQLQAHLSGHKHKGKASKSPQKTEISSSDSSSERNYPSTFPSTPALSSSSKRRASADFIVRSHNRLSFSSSPIVVHHLSRRHRSSGSLSQLSSRTRFSLNKGHSKSMIIPQYEKSSIKIAKSNAKMTSLTMLKTNCCCCCPPPHNHHNHHRHHHHHHPCHYCGESDESDSEICQKKSLLFLLQRQRSYSARKASTSSSSSSLSFNDETEESKQLRQIEHGDDDGVHT